MQAIFELSLQQLVERIRTGRIKARDLLASVYDNIERYDGQLNVFLSLVDKNRAMRWAEVIDGKAVKGEPLGKLAGIPVALKDNIAIEDAQLKTTCASRILENFQAPYNATVVEKLLREDALIIGKTNMDEFAMGSSTENSAYLPTRNPWNPERVPGGSSGGAAVSIATGMALLALGQIPEDPFGSLRPFAELRG